MRFSWRQVILMRYIITGHNTCISHLSSMLLNLSVPISLQNTSYFISSVTSRLHNTGSPLATQLGNIQLCLTNLENLSNVILFATAVTRAVRVVGGSEMLHNLSINLKCNSSKYYSYHLLNTSTLIQTGTSSDSCRIFFDLNRLISVPRSGTTTLLLLTVQC